MTYVFKYCTEQRNRVPARVAIQSRFPRSEIPSSFPLTSKKKLYRTPHTLLKYHYFSRIPAIPKKSNAFEYANVHHENCCSHMLENYHVDHLLIPGKVAAQQRAISWMLSESIQFPFCAFTQADQLHCKGHLKLPGRA